MGRAMIGFGAVYDLLKPDILIVLGDRYEIFSAVAVALIAKIPVAHIHGGEKTEGAFDDALRNAITKMSHLHFVAANEYEKRVIQLGEQPDRVFNVGGLGVDNVSSMPLLERTKIEEILGVTFFKKNLLVTYHPETLSASDPTKQMEVLLSVLSELRDTRLIFTFSNPDPFGLNFIKIIEDFVKTHDNAKIFSSLGSECYLSCLAEVDGVVGNSSSGILEAPSLKTGTINIGDRQRGRLLADSIIQTEPTKKAIKTAIDRLYSKEFQGLLATVESPFGVGGAGDRILNIVRDVRLENLVKKSFYDLHIESLNS
jgi:GDP/UDP-N,N'-diacetylbacillosamine 2-epimerase (hydrolysing)